LRSETLSVLQVRNDNRILAFQRWLPGEGRDVVVVASLNDNTFTNYELPWPGIGRWREIFNSDSYDDYPAHGNGGGIEAYDVRAIASRRQPAFLFRPTPSSCSLASQDTSLSRAWDPKVRQKS
jgi:Alpha amylase, C-terminal all-beta domain